MILQSAHHQQSHTFWSAFPVPTFFKKTFPPFSHSLKKRQILGSKENKLSVAALKDYIVSKTETARNWSLIKDNTQSHSKNTLN